MKKTLWTRRSALALFCCAAAGLAGMRVSVVNGNRTVIPEKYYAEGEWLSMDGAFLGSKDVVTDGYSFCIDGQSCSRRASISNEHMTIIQNMAPWIRKRD